MRDLLADIGRKRVQRPDLIRDHALEIVGAHVDAAATESPEIIETRMRADTHALLLRAFHHSAHGDRIAGVKAAGDTGGTNDLQDRIVVADRIGAEPLAHVRVQIDNTGHRSTLRRVRCTPLGAGPYGSVVTNTTDRSNAGEESGCARGYGSNRSSCRRAIPPCWSNSATRSTAA